MVDRIRLQGLRAKGFHGVFPQERRDGQEFVVDAELEVDLRRAASTDRLAETVDYGVLAQRLHDIVTGEPVDLIETLTHRLAFACLQDPRVHAATVTVHKPQAPIPLPFENVSVTLRRARKAAVLSLGSNLGDRLAHLTAGLAVLRSRLAVHAVSPVYETAPVGGPEQGPYLNAVVLAGVPDGPAALAAAHAAEQAEGRERLVRFGPRTLDVDVITVAGERSDEPDLLLPHPRAHERAFVLAPWRDLDPGAVLPGRGAIAVLLRDRLQAGDQVTRRDDLVLR
ncbi:MAG TPA: dihydroneopterin aldolase [Mycobacteriales bacterium]|jgi:dihydroneopterin aldolase/2-amino-4-hydroxy-6-hydroxymethyldihydropteridine diphosphokinase|nr:dihydroneopterin aldolase [Mycobacteriales bacterium]